MESFQDFFGALLQSLEQTDKSVLLSINSLHNGFFDSFMYLFSEKWVWVPIYVAMFYSIVKRKKQETIFIALGIILTVVLCDQFSSHLCKPLFHRFRPAQDPVIGQLVHVVCNNRGDLYGFISSHAANTVGLAVFLSLLFRNRLFSYTISLWALVNCYSRMYLGVHYLGDIICGGLSGALWGWLCFVIYKKLLVRFPQYKCNMHSNNSRSNVDFPTSDMMPFVWTFITTVFLFAIMSTEGLRCIY